MTRYSPVFTKIRQHGENSIQMELDLDISDLKLYIFFLHELYVLYVLPYGLFELTTPSA